MNSKARRLNHIEGDKFTTDKDYISSTKNYSDRNQQNDTVQTNLDRSKLMVV
jgi:hypothetical protein